MKNENSCELTILIFLFFFLNLIKDIDEVDRIETKNKNEGKISILMLMNVRFELGDLICFFRYLFLQAIRHWLFFSFLTPLLFSLLPPLFVAFCFSPLLVLDPVLFNCNDTFLKFVVIIIITISKMLHRFNWIFDKCNLMISQADGQID